MVWSPTSVGLTAVFVLMVILAARLWLRARALTKRFSGVLNADREKDKVEKEGKKLRKQVEAQRSKWKAEYETTIEQLEVLSQELDRVRDTVEMQSFGLYEPQHDYDTSEEYKEALRVNRDLQKRAIREKRAAVCDTKWELQGTQIERFERIAANERYDRLLWAAE